MKSLKNYLERKRLLFTRFFYLSNEEVISTHLGFFNSSGVYGDPQRHENICAFLPKMFEGIE